MGFTALLDIGEIMLLNNRGYWLLTSFERIMWDLELEENICWLGYDTTKILAFVTNHERKEMKR